MSRRKEAAMVAPNIEERVSKLEEGDPVARRNARDIKDLKVLGQDLIRDVEDLSQALEQTEERLGAKIDALDAKIDNVEQRLEAKIDALDAKIDNVEQRLEAKIDSVASNLDTKIDLLAESSKLILKHLGVKPEDS